MWLFSVLLSRQSELPKVKAPKEKSEKGLFKGLFKSGPRVEMAEAFTVNDEDDDGDVLRTRQVGSGGSKKICLYTILEYYYFETSVLPSAPASSYSIQPSSSSNALVPPCPCQPGRPLWPRPRLPPPHVAANRTG
jgi:hypothetical protein